MPTRRGVNTTGGAPTGRAALVDLSSIAVARDLAPSVTVLKERYAGFDEIGIWVITRYDVAPVHPECIVTLAGITI